MRTSDLIADDSGSSGDDYRQLEHERIVLFLRVLLYVHLFLATMFLLLPQLGFSGPERPWLVYVLVLGTPPFLFILMQIARAAFLRPYLGVVDLVTTWELTTLYIRTTLLSGSEGSSLFPLAIVALVLTVRAAIVPSTIGRTFWVGIVAVTAVIVAAFLYPRAHEPTGAVIWTGLIGLCFVATTMVTSWVIYGLQRRIADITKLGQYVLEQKLGEGGMGKVYLARHAMLRRQAAVKLLNDGAQVSRSAADRFREEVQFTSRLSHPNTVQVFDYGVTATGQFFYAMEYLNGATLQAIIDATGPMPEARVAYVLKKVAASLVEAHGEGLLHRDIKPANVMLCRLGGVLDTVKVLDFGLVQAVESTGQSESSTDGARLEGTPGYLAPECIVDAAGSEPRSDLYSLGAVAYFILCGVPLFPDADLIDVLANHLTETPVPPSERLGRDVDPELEALILSCLEKNPDHRPPSAEDVLRRALRLSGRMPWTPVHRATWWTEHEGVMESYREVRAANSERVAQRLWVGRRSYSSAEG